MLVGVEPEVVEPALAGPEVGVLAGLAVAELTGLADDVEAEAGTEDVVSQQSVFAGLCNGSL